jgi:hypothetical protein
MALSHEEDGSMSRKRHRPDSVLIVITQVLAAAGFR